MLINSLQEGDKVGIVSCSDGREISNKEVIEHTKEIIESIGFINVESPYIYRKRGLESGTPAKRAAVLMDMYRDDSIKAIFDIGGGDLAIQLLEYLDFNIIRDCNKEFWGYSDLTVIINSIYTKTGKTSWLYQVRKLAESDNQENIQYFSDIAKGIMPEAYCGLPPEEIYFLQGEKMEGILLGGNIRCFLKLAGTEFFPNLDGKILFLESLEGGAGIVAAWLTQLKLLGVFDKISGLILGTYTSLDRSEGVSMIETLVRETVNNPSLPIARTMRVGHDIGSYALHIGMNYIITKN